MAEVINLNQQRKSKARAEKDKNASANRAKFGRTKEEKNREKLTSERDKKHLDGHMRETDDES